MRNATLEMVVTSDGRIEEYRVEFQGTHDGAVVRGERLLWYEAVGETTVEAPGWLDEVEDRNGTGETEDRTGISEKTVTTRNGTETTQAS